MLYIYYTRTVQSLSGNLSYFVVEYTIIYYLFDRARFNFFILKLVRGIVARQQVWRPIGWRRGATDGSAGVLFATQPLAYSSRVPVLRALVWKLSRIYIYIFFLSCLFRRIYQPRSSIARRACEIEAAGWTVENPIFCNRNWCVFWKQKKKKGFRTKPIRSAVGIFSLTSRRIQRGVGTLGCRKTIVNIICVLHRTNINNITHAHSM